MTTVITSFIAIVLFGMIMVGTINYNDALGYDATGHSIELVQRLQSGVEVVSRVQHDTGSRPTSLEELQAAGLPSQAYPDGSQWQMHCDDERCSPIALCLALPADSASTSAVRSAAGKIKGHASGVCGNDDAAIGETAVVSISI